ncbi:MAG: serine/threonine protein kinase [Myxococcales bacterium]|nr:serine/threonine protein kinase [Myxococcales bacterium]
MLGRYEVLAPLAEGGMAIVWLGRAADGRLVALKQVKAHLAEDDHFQRMFADEARIASRVAHPNVAETLAVGARDDQLFLALEYVDGESLSRLRRAAARAGERVPVGIALRIAADLCAGLHAAHEARDAENRRLDIVHRDVSPQNVLLTAGGAVKLIDFGIARAEARSAAATADGHFKGKAPYMAPEQLAGATIDRRVDVWAVGVVLYELIAGRLPFEGDSQEETMAILASGRPAAPLRGVPEGVRRTVRRALAHEATERFATAAELGQALEEALADVGGSTARDVAAFVERHLGDRLAQRRHTVEVAIERAAMRARRAHVALRTPVPGEHHTLSPVEAKTPPPPRSRRRDLWRVGLVLGLGLSALVFGRSALSQGDRGASVLAGGAFSSRAAPLAPPPPATASTVPEVLASPSAPPPVAPAPVLVRTPPVLAPPLRPWGDDPVNAPQ